MDIRQQVREFLATRRARLSPPEVGLAGLGIGRRRVPGLRREEVAMLAGISVEYYTRMERGNLRGVSASVLDALARALRLDEVEHAHLYDLAQAANSSESSVRRTVSRRVRPTVTRMLEAIDAPAWVRNGRSDFLAGNLLGRVLYQPLFLHPQGTPNTARFMFLDPRARDFYLDWDDVASQMVAVLHAEAGTSPYDKGLSDLIGELTTRSQEFSARWAAHEVMRHESGAKRIHHPVVGDLDLTYEAMSLAADPGQVMIVYGAEPGSASDQALKLLASWAVTDADQTHSTSQEDTIHD